jgi:hypothetical protein
VTSRTPLLPLLRRRPAPTGMTLLSFGLMTMQRDNLFILTPKTLCYNVPFSMDERLLAIGRPRNTSSGPDGIHNQILSHLSPSAKEFLLSLFNRIWEEHCFPSCWREEIVILVLKPGKDRTLPSSCRPTASLPVFAKQWIAWSTTALSSSWRRKTC